MKSHPKIIDRILEGIRASRTICVVGHVRPDGDCVGSQLGLTLALRNEGKKVVCWNEDRIPQKYEFLDRSGIIQKPKAGLEFDCVVATDAASFERLGSVGPCIGQRKLFINIDHHESNTRFADINWVSAREPSTGELVFRLLKVAKWPITKPIADSLFTAVSTDTGSFQYPSTRPSTFNVAGELVRRGANLAKICDEVYQSYPVSRARLLRHIYSHFRLTHNDQIAYFWLRRADFARSGADSSDAEGLIDHIRAIAPVVVACVFEEVEPQLTRVSLRSKSEKVNVSEIAAHFGGGGHPAAAGARIAGSRLSAQQKVVAAVKAALKSAS
ncbi:MAG TPA: bifunctional oligoribonuclease/PAP phosphatase NrnA [Candidatus Paceibacterota bacterium]|nr:bifunctional oligoribonuclease/PAP phosphatase NrnA [Verrucomicrobiota bacterium]HSA11148.1 bifunctional oligoribonuclease/PAP phosphatase NrnA [Candidatus Paceibacterota bacterium]